jgi:hypothetical protein
VHRNGLRLLITVWQFESVIQVTLFRESSDVALMDFTCFVRGEVRHINDGRGNYLSLEDCVVAPSRFSYIEAGNSFNHDRFPFGITLTIRVRPDIQIAMVPYQSRT